MRPPYGSTLFNLLLEQADSRPDRPAVICGGRIACFASLAATARLVAGALRARGIRRGDRVGILLNNRLEWLEICFGASALGAVVVPFSSWSKATELEYLLADSGVSALFAIDRFGGQDFAGALATLVPESRRAGDAEWRSRSFPELRLIATIGTVGERGWIGYDSLLSDAAPLDPPPPGEGASAADDCFILYTSGSSARPKAVRLAHYGVVENGFNIGERMGLDPDDRVLLAPPLFWSYGAANALPAVMTHGATLVLQGRFEPGEWLQLIESHRCSAVYTLPSMTAAAVGHPSFSRERTRSLRTGLMIGAPEDVRVAATVLAAPEICNIYGATETYGNCCVTPRNMPLARRMASQGPPLPGFTVRIADPMTREPLPQGAIGAVEVSGYTTRGYWGGSAEFNGGAFTADGHFRTGDLGMLDENGEFHFVARDSDVIKRAGINVSPAEVESVLQAHADVAQAAVVGVPDRRRGEAIVAFVVPSPGAAVTGDALRAHCRSLMSSYKVPDHIEICSSLPMTETGKLFRRSLKETASMLATSRRAGG